MADWIGINRRARRCYGFDEVALVPSMVTVNPTEVEDKEWELFIIHTSDGDMSTFNADWAKLVASTSGTSTRWIIPTKSENKTVKNGAIVVRKTITEQPRKA